MQEIEITTSGDMGRAKSTAWCVIQVKSDTAHVLLQALPLEEAAELLLEIAEKEPALAYYLTPITWSQV